MIKKIIISTCLLLSLVSYAQEGTSSPYSLYGIGDVRFKGSLESRSMAGLSIEPDSIHINLQNPAGYSSLRYTTFSLGGTYNTTNQKTSSKSASARRTTLDYLAVGLPLGKFGAGFGLIPYSSVGYKIKFLSDTQNSKLYSGTGGLNKAFLGLGYVITPKLSFGADAQYNFGKIETVSVETIPNVLVGSRELNTAILSGVNFNFGLMYQNKINKKLTFDSSLRFSPESNLFSKNTQNIGLELSAVDPLYDIKSEAILKLPSKLSLGAGIGEFQKWLLGAEITLQSKGSLANTYNTTSAVTYGKGAKYSIGGYYVPNYKSYTNYAKRITYRGGFKFEKTGLVVNSQSINDLGMTLGLGLPLSGTFSNINFGFEFGKKGTTTSNLVQENYANISVGFSFNDKWFVKSKFY